MLMSKSHESELIQQEDSEVVKKELLECQQDCLNYLQQSGKSSSVLFEENCCHIPRQHGRDISLMTEIVYK